jgi:hypothetical protein
VDLGPNHKFCIFLHAEGFVNAQKGNQTSFWIKWSRMEAFDTKPFLRLLYTEHKFCIFFMLKVL